MAATKIDEEKIAVVAPIGSPAVAAPLIAEAATEDKLAPSLNGPEGENSELGDEPRRRRRRGGRNRNRRDRENGETGETANAGEAAFVPVADAAMAQAETIAPVAAELAPEVTTDKIVQDVSPATLAPEPAVAVATDAVAEPTQEMVQEAAPEVTEAEVAEAEVDKKPADKA